MRDSIDLLTRNSPRTESYSSSFDQLFASIRLAHKYQIEHVERGGLAILEGYFFCSLDRWLSIAQNPFLKSCNPIGVINLARLTDTPALLPVAFFLACHEGGKLLDGWTRKDGSVEFLSTEDIKRCMDGRNTLADSATQLLLEIFAPMTSLDCHDSLGGCRRAMASLIVELNCHVVPSGIDMLDSWCDFIKDQAKESGLCGTCVTELLERDEAERKGVWHKLPSTFSLSVEGWPKA